MGMLPLEQFLRYGQNMRNITLFIRKIQQKRRMNKILRFRNEHWKWHCVGDWPKWAVPSDCTAFAAVHERRPSVAEASLRIIMEKLYEQGHSEWNNTTDQTISRFRKISFGRSITDGEGSGLLRRTCVEISKLWNHRHFLLELCLGDSPWPLTYVTVGQLGNDASEQTPLK